MRYFLFLLFLVTLLPTLLFADVNESALRQIKEEIRTGRLSSAEAKLLESLKKNPEDFELNYLLGRLLLKKEENQKAISPLKLALKNATNAKIIAKIQELLLKIEKPTPPEKAEPRFGGAAWEMEKSLNFLLDDRPTEAIEILTRVLAQSKTHPQASILLLVARCSQDPSIAIATELKKILELHPKDGFVIAFACYARWQKGERAGIVDQCQQLLAVEQTNPEVYLIAGQILQLNGNYQQALQGLNHFLEKMPDHAWGHLFKSQVIHQTQGVEAALQAVDLALDQVKNPAPLWVQRGILRLSASDQSGAENAFKKALITDPKNAAALNGIGWLYLLNGDGENALSFLSKAIAANPRFEQAYANLALVALEQQNPGEVKRLAETLLEARPDSLTAMNLLGRSLTELNKPEEAIKWFNLVLKKNPDHGDALLNLARLLGSLQKYQEALPVFQRLDVISPGNQEVVMMLGFTYLQVGDVTNAKTKLEETVQLGPESELAIQAAQILQTLQ